MITNQAGIDLILSFEGYHTLCKDGSGDCVAYLDKLASKKSWSKGYNGLWTCGWGSTGSNVTEGTRWTREQARAQFQKHLAQKEAAVNALIDEGLFKFEVDQNQFDAMMSGAYNFGEGNLRKLVIKAGGDEDQMAKLWLNFATNGGIKGLVRRRKEEVALFTKYTDKQVVQASNQMSLVQKVRNYIGTSGIASFFSAPLWNDYKVVLIVCGFASIAGIAWYFLGKSNSHALNAVREGRYKPSKMIIPAMDGE